MEAAREAVTRELRRNPRGEGAPGAAVAVARRPAGRRAARRGVAAYRSFDRAARVVAASLRVRSRRLGRARSPTRPSRVAGSVRAEWATFGKQNWRCGMNRTSGYGA